MIEQEYKDALRRIMSSGELRSNRTNTNAFSVFCVDLKFNLANGFPLMTSKFIDFRIIETEFQWFLNGETDIKRFQANNIKIWDAWADARGNLGPVYGYQMRNFNGDPGQDQLLKTIYSLENNPHGRRHIISLWNPLQLDQMALPPCYLYFQFYVSKDKLNMFVVQRSGDMFAGVPYDLGLFAYFLIYMCAQTDLKPGQVSVKIIDAHIYEDHVPGVSLYLSRKDYKLPFFTYSENGIVSIQNYISEPRIKINIAK